MQILKEPESLFDPSSGTPNGLYLTKAEVKLTDKNGDPLPGYIVYVSVSQTDDYKKAVMDVPDLSEKRDPFSVLSDHRVRKII